MSLKSLFSRARHGFRSQSTERPTDLQGDFGSWADARAASTGYDSDAILEKTRSALLKVKNGEAAFERDSVVFPEIEHNWPALAALMFAAARSNGKLNVLDFGGSLGSTYYQVRHFLAELDSVRWNVVEQQGHVDVGRKWFENEQLRFYGSIKECLAATQPNTVLVSSVLQYLEYPYSTFDELLHVAAADTIIIDRTPFWDGNRDFLSVQVVPPEIYQASYPSWIFSRKRFDSQLPDSWKRIATFACQDRLSGPIELAYEGMIIVRKDELREPRLRGTISS